MTVIHIIILSTLYIYSLLHVSILSHRCSTTVSLEIYPFINHKYTGHECSYLLKQTYISQILQDDHFKLIVDVRGVP